MLTIIDNIPKHPNAVPVKFYWVHQYCSLWIYLGFVIPYSTHFDIAFWIHSTTNSTIHSQVSCIPLICSLVHSDVIHHYQIPIYYNHLLSIVVNHSLKYSYSLIQLHYLLVLHSSYSFKSIVSLVDLYLLNECKVPTSNFILLSIA